MWPATHSTNSSTVHAKRKAENVFNYPVLDHGTLAAATLLEQNGRLEWTNITSPHRPALLKAGIPVTVFPATRPRPSTIPPMTILQRAEQGANFLRTYAPDIDIAAELMRKELTDDAKIVQEFETFDPHIGNQLETIICSDSSAFIAFPMGELSRDLNVSPFVLSSNGEATLTPSAQSIHTFDTPIRQITASKPKENSPSYLAVRSFGPTSLLELKPSRSNVRVTELASVGSADTGGKQVIDVKIAPSPLQATLVNIEGAVYRCELGGGQKSIRLVREGVSPAENTNMFWRLELTQDNERCLLLSTSHLSELDFRTPTTSSPLYTTTTPPNDDILTSVEDFQADDLIRLCTTSQVIWLDRRNAARPVLAWRHGRAYDRSLEARSIHMGGDGYLTTLSSRTNGHGLLTVYDVSRGAGEGGTVYARAPSPYCLTTSTSTSIAGGEGEAVQTTGRTFFRHPAAAVDAPVTLFTLSEVGCIRAVLLSLSGRGEGEGEGEVVGEVGFVWDDDLERLDAQSAGLREDFFGEFGERAPSVFDLSATYDQIFRAHRERSDTEAAEAAAESLYDLVEKAPSYWQDLNDPVEHLLTSYDVLFRSGDEPPTPAHSAQSRADFLSASPITSTRGFRALLQGRISAESLRRDAKWDHSIVDTLRQFDPDMGVVDARALAERLRRFDLKQTPSSERTAGSLRRESEAREEVVLDLALARHVYSARAFAAALGTHASELESMTKGLSLDGEPPAVSFGFLHPIPPRSNDDLEEEEDKDKGQVMPMGVRLLMKDWELGADPRAFAYRDPYTDGDAPPPPPEERAAPPHPQVSAAPPKLQRPPPVVASSSTQPAADSNQNQNRYFMSMSQDTNPQHPMGGSQPLAGGLGGISQDTTTMMASTQILPGAYGGRPGGNNKKKVVGKKRLGGF